MNRIYACIDLKSFYASCECVERGLNPLTTNLVVADKSRTEKTICLAITPSLKKYGLQGRARLFEVIEKIKEINDNRLRKLNGKKFIAKSFDITKLENNNNLYFDYIIATPRMSLYMKYSTDIYNIYLKYLSKDDIHVYSIDEIFCDITNYLKYYKKNANELISMIIKDIYQTTGITATAGIGTNLYLAKIAMDIVAKKKEPDEYGVRIAFLDEKTYRKELWNHEPITDFWRVGNGTACRLAENYMYTMEDIAKCSIENEDLLYKLFGINAELLIDHAWGNETCTIESIKNYKTIDKSLSKGQVLTEPYNFDDSKIIVREMAELLTLEMLEKGYATNLITLTIGYDIENLKNKKIRSLYNGEIVKDYYGREVPKSSHGSTKINHKTSSIKLITESLINLFEKIGDPFLLIRRINISVGNLELIENIKNNTIYEQLDLFNDNEKIDLKNKNAINDEKKEIKVEQAILNIKKRYGKNAILKGMNLEQKATTIMRNNQIGGHRC